ncbi:hypothetical protein IDM40_27240 [Nocardiopsis sp. HNM0947]|uniref:HTH araC/xylS-type domain-containing protein n=1 Tax=Nocardiopsis coralli TaxID=2772213 RepID=A0ABR9PEU7_9ACTN|nr:hypothetical protein [Nocardiopsis coralli]MBE3002365.1 hypothetical protein [Nocardiopsis coralli]
MASGHGADRIEGFEAAASRAFAPLRMHTGDGGPGFRGTFESTRVDEVVLTRIRADPVVVRRDRSVMGSSDPDLIKVAWHVAGSAGVEQGDRRCVLEPGDLVVYETGHPYELPFWESYDTVVAGVPAHLFGAHADLLRRRTAVPVRAGAGLGGLLGPVFEGMAAGTGEGSASSAQHHLATALVSLVCAAFTDAVPEDGSDPWERIRSYCLARLGDPDLSVVSVAARWGVLDAGHLGRMLRAEFGESAREIRARAREGRADAQAGRVTGPDRPFA